MMLFYDHLTPKHEISTLIEKLEGPENHKSKLKQLVDDILHQGVIEFVLQKLHPHHHHHFMSTLEEEPYSPTIIIFLNEKIHPKFEEELATQIKQLIEDIKKDFA